jgi:hypothetical protein
MSKMHVHFHCGHHDRDREIVRRIQAVIRRLDALAPSTHTKEKVTEMSQSDDVTVALSALDAATNALASRVQALIDQINNTSGVGLNGPQTEAVLAHLALLKSQLESLGANPTTPLPPPGPAPAPVPQ